MTDHDQADWLTDLDAAISDLGTPAPRPFPPTPIPSQPSRAAPDPCKRGADGNGRDGFPDDREADSRSGKSKPLTTKALPAFPVLPDPESAPHTETHISSVRRRATDADTSDFRAHVKYQKDREMREMRETRNESIIDQHLGRLPPFPDPSSLFPMIGKCPEDLIDLYEERAAILEYDAGMSRRDAEARALDHLKAIGLTPPSGWRPAR